MARFSGRADRRRKVIGIIIGDLPLDMAAGYFAAALLLALWGWYDTKARNRNKDAGHETKMQATDFSADTDKT